MFLHFKGMKSDVFSKSVLKQALLEVLGVSKTLDVLLIAQNSFARLQETMASNAILALLTNITPHLRH